MALALSGTIGTLSPLGEIRKGVIIKKIFDPHHVNHL
jgi:hypothetical protein